VKLKLLKMKKSMFTAFALGLCLTANLMAQVPNYVPTNGLVGWWPFNGNANDESGNGNNGTVNGATLTTDRFGVANKAYSFDGVDDFIEFGDIQSLNNSNAFSVSVFFNYNNFPSFPNDWYTVVADGSYADLDGWGILIKSDQILMRELDNFNGLNLNYNFSLNNWYHIAATCESDSIKLFINGQFLGGYFNLQPNLTLNTSNSFRVGNGTINNVPANSWPYYFSGKIDDLGLWNRALTNCEINNLYNSQLTAPFINAGADQTICKGDNVTLNATGGSNYQWNNNVVDGQTFSPIQTTNYSVQGTDSLGCIGTDFIVVTVLENSASTLNETALDTYTLNGQTYTQSGTYTQTIPAANGCDSIITLNLTLSFTGIVNQETYPFTIYPNPATKQITIDNGNFSAMVGYSIKITNNAGQQVFQNAINQAQFYVDLSTWTGNGLYFVHLIDPQNNTVTVRKIVLQ
jgi:hypothetical protein